MTEGKGLDGYIQSRSLGTLGQVLWNHCRHLLRGASPKESLQRGEQLLPASAKITPTVGCDLP